MASFSDSGSSGPAGAAAAVTKSDATVIPPTRAIFVGGAGDLVVRMKGGQTTVTFTGVPAGALLPISVDQVLDATTATNIVAMW